MVFKNIHFIVSINGPIQCKINCNICVNMKIAFLFLIIDKINSSKLWERFFKEAPKDSYSIYIHQKIPADLGWFNKFVIKEVIDTKWGTISIVNAQNLLLEKALSDPKNDMFLFVSGACLPIKNIKHIRANLDTGYSYFNMIFLTKNNPFRHTLKRNKMMNGGYEKASQWCILNRSHTKILLDEKDIMLEKFKNYPPPDEIAYLTTLCSKNILQIKNVETTMFNVSGDKTPGYVKLNPKQYFLMDVNEYKTYTMNNTPFFMRKIESGCLLCVNNHDSYPGKNAHIMYDMNVNNQTHIKNAYKLCLEKGYGGFVYHKNKFYFRKYTTNELLKNVVKYESSVLVLAITLEDQIIDDVYSSSSSQIKML